MPSWDPPSDAISENEIIGRRVFDKHNKTIADIESVNPNTFFDDRLDDDLSLDRLGFQNPDKLTRRILTPICDEAAKSNQKTFHGWAATHAKKIKLQNIRPDPLTKEQHGIDNKFHALLSRVEDRSERHAFALSRLLYMQFKEGGQFVSPIRSA